MSPLIAFYPLSVVTTSLHPGFLHPGISVDGHVVPQVDKDTQANFTMSLLEKLRGTEALMDTWSL